jgi:hypothetical protein
MSTAAERRVQAISERTIHLNDLKDSVDKKAYVVDPRAVAEALLRRVVDLRRSSGTPGPRLF